MKVKTNGRAMKRLHRNHNKERTMKVKTTVKAGDLQVPPKP